MTDGGRRRRRSFTPEYRVTAAHQVIDGHRRVADVARELDMDTSLLHTWVRDERWRMSAGRGADTQPADPDDRQPVSVEQRAELMRLRATVAEQATEIAFLEEVLAHFAAAASKASRLELAASACACRGLTPMAELLGVSTVKRPKLTHLP